MYRKNGYTEPSAVLYATQEYQQANDNYGDFVLEHIEKTDPHQILYVDELFAVFQFWYKRTVSDKTPTRRDLQKYMEKKCGPISMINGKKG